RQIVATIEVLKGFRRTVTGRRQTVGAQPHPGQEGDQRDVLEDRLVVQIARPADDDRLDLLGERLLAPLGTTDRRHHTIIAAWRFAYLVFGKRGGAILVGMRRGGDVADGAVVGTSWRPALGCLAAGGSLSLTAHRCTVTKEIRPELPHQSRSFEPFVLR